MFWWRDFFFRLQLIKQWTMKWTLWRHSIVDITAATTTSWYVFMISNISEVESKLHLLFLWISDSYMNLRNQYTLLWVFIGLQIQALIQINRRWAPPIKDIHFTFKINSVDLPSIPMCFLPLILFLSCFTHAMLSWFKFQTKEIIWLTSTIQPNLPVPFM